MYAENLLRNFNHRQFRYLFFDLKKVIVNALHTLSKYIELLMKTMQNQADQSCIEIQFFIECLH
jgi:hypothetical protein